MPPVGGVEKELELNAAERSIALFGRRVTVVTVAGVVALIVSWLGILYFAEPWGRLAGSGMDARCYWAPDISNPYLHSSWTEQIAYPYSPIFLQALQPIRLLPWQPFMAVWAAILMAAMVYLTGPRLILVGLACFGLMEIWGGNIEMLIALAIVLGFRWPATWSFVLLTKITPGIGLLWFAVRREWRSLGIALGATAAVVAVSAAVAPEQWLQWRDVLVANMGKNGTWAAVPVPFLARLPLALVLVMWGARSNRRWTVPVSAMLALPALWYGGLSILLATLPLLDVRTWADLRRVARAARADVEAWLARVSRRPASDTASP
jgi:hypothetical protein